MNDSPERPPSLLDRWWVRALVAGWVLAIVTVYFWRQIQRVVQLAGGLP